jgi:hypothetical protein
MQWPVSVILAMPEAEIGKTIVPHQSGQKKISMNKVWTWCHTPAPPLAGHLK